MSELLAGEVYEGQVVEAGGDGGVVLDEGAAVGVLGEQLVNPGVVTQQTAVGSERQAAEIAPANTQPGDLQLQSLKDLSASNHKLRHFAITPQTKH